jgi:hypothetical protein
MRSETRMANRGTPPVSTLAWLGLAGLGIRLARVCDLATTICAKTSTSYITVILSVANVLAADVFGSVIFH